MGYDATNDIFAENAWYFRNALVRANYVNLKENIHETTVYLERFMRNLLLNENNELKNRYLHICNTLEQENIAIKQKNIAIEQKNIAIDKAIAEMKFNIQTKTNIKKLYEIVGTEVFFGRKDVSKICDISYSTAGNLISKMREKQLICEVKGYGKGKYRFC